MIEPTPTVGDRADRYFQEGYNCAQAVLRAVAESSGLECAQCVPGVALAMGGGVGHAGYTCGAVTGAVMALGLAVDRFGEGSLRSRKEEAYRLGGEFVADFTGEFGSPECCVLLGFSPSAPGAAERFQREQVKQKKCTRYVRWAAEEAARLADRIVGGER